MTFFAENIVCNVILVFGFSDIGIYYLCGLVNRLKIAAINSELLLQTFFLVLLLAF